MFDKRPSASSGHSWLVLPCAVLACALLYFIADLILVLEDRLGDQGGVPFIAATALALASAWLFRYEWKNRR